MEGRRLVVELVSQGSQVADGAGVGGHGQSHALRVVGPGCTSPRTSPAEAASAPALRLPGSRPPETSALPQTER